MQIVKAHAEFEYFGYTSPTKKIELVGRLCYKSNDKISRYSDEVFVENLIKHKHGAMLEHAIFVLEVSSGIYTLIRKMNPKFLNLTNENSQFIISGSSRAFTELYSKYNSSIALRIILIYLKSKYPVLFINFNDTTHNDFEFKDDYVCELQKHEIKKLSESVRIIHNHLTAKIICDRGVSHEWVRHRVASFAQESTRYCNYFKEKFGRQITVVDPLFYKSELKRFIWKFACKTSEICYMMLLRLGSTPQEARSVLPNSLKTEMFITASEEEWRHIFLLRDAPTAHPQMVEVAHMLHNEYRFVYGTYMENNC